MKYHSSTCSTVLRLVQISFLVNIYFYLCWYFQKLLIISPCLCLCLSWCLCVYTGIASNRPKGKQTAGKRVRKYEEVSDEGKTRGRVGADQEEQSTRIVSLLQTGNMPPYKQTSI